MSVYSLLDDQNKDVGKKLGIATLCMFTLPILTYYIVHEYCLYQYTLKNISKTYIELFAGGSAILMTNIIIGTYCYYAYCEDLYDQVTGEVKIINNDDDYRNDEDYPKVGIYKKRTD